VTGLHIFGISGIPEVTEGADLAEVIVDAATAASTPLQDGDVVVVTSKIVSKAEGRIIELSEVEPSPFAVAWSTTWDKDPAVTEVVLREAKRVVRQLGPVLITETHHGFVCANGGIDASNVGPASGQVVTLLPRDPDASATGIRAAIRSRFGVDVPVVVSDSFGRPWRWGITDVAIGISGMLPLDDLRGVADHDGRVMRSTVRAVADQVASAAELAFGKTTARPAAIVRGAHPTRGEATIKDALIPGDFDLFR